MPGAAPAAAPGPAVWVNGERRSGEAHVSARDRGLTLGDGVFETMRARHARVFRLERHLARLARSLAILQIAVPDGLHGIVQRAVGEWPERDASIRLTVTRGVGEGGLAPPREPRPTVLVTVSAMPAFPDAIYRDGLSAQVASGRRNERSMTAGLKTLAYVDSVAGLLEAQHAGADEALFLDTEDHVSEASASNCFLWTGETLLTPPPSCAALPGITRAAVMEIATGLGLSVAERPVGLDDLRSARESFLTSSLRAVAPLVSVDGAAIGSGTPGPMTRRIMNAYAAVVERECGPHPGAQ
jgi:branched-chain amino acid aminotransferase